MAIQSKIDKLVSKDVDIIIEGIESTRSPEDAFRIIEAMKWAFTLFDTFEEDIMDDAIAAIGATIASSIKYQHQLLENGRKEIERLINDIAAIYIATTQDEQEENDDAEWEEAMKRRIAEDKRKRKAKKKK